MSRPAVLITAALLVALPQPDALARRPGRSGPSSPSSTEASVTALSTHPVLAPWTGPYGGVPPFDRIDADQLAPGLREAMAMYRAEIDAIAHARGKATFDNTIAALEDAGRALSRVMAVYGIYTSNLSSPAVQAVEAELEPELAGFFDAITQNDALFARVEDVYTRRDKAGLTPEQQRLVWLVYTRFVRQGAKLDADSKTRLSAINQELAGLYTQFSKHLLADEDTAITLAETDLAGLSASTRAAMATAATERGLDGQWVVVNTRSSVDPFLTESSRRDLRERVWRAFVNRGDNGGETDNNAIITRILALRAERAKLLGYPTHAHWRLEPSMAHTPERAMALMEAVWGPAVAKVHAEVADMQAIADARGDGITIAPWDYHFYQELVRKDRYDFDQNVLRPYLQLENLREGMFWMAGELYGLHFTAVTDVPVYHPDVRVWKVTDGDGALVGLWYFDPYARSGKRSGAWMNAYRDQERFHGEVTTIVSNNANFVKGAPGEPVLVSWDDAETLFHEFGHALHGLLSDVTYPTVAGTSVPRDYVEFPSQLHEHWLGTPEILSRFARHVETGEPLPQALIDKLHAASTFNQGFGTVEYLASALIDMKLHLAGDTPIDPDAFERDTLAALGMPDELVMRHRTPQFGHVFSGDGYSAGYYSYLWADTLTADAAEAFVEAGSMYDAATAKRLVDDVLSVGNTIDPADGFRAFRGRDVSIDALMRDRGLVPAE
ncbi:MAG: M3 family metallopeptidase [Alphaproteobacteria bacterium]|nr:M3 family metallopeptidase [Alphaproteobacteria bacterium]